MQRHTKETGAALILLIGITAALAILTGALVMLLANQQGATASERTTKTSLYYAEAALDSGVNAIKATTTVSTKDFPYGLPDAQIDMSQMNTEYAVACPSPAPTPIYKVYDNVSGADTGVAYDVNMDHRVWVQATVTYQGHTSRLREMLDSSTTASILPEAALYADTDIVASGTSDVYAVKPDWSFYTAGIPPYVTSIMAGGDITGNSSTNLSPPLQSPAKQTLGINVNGSVSLPAITENGVTIGGVGLLSDYFDQARQYALTVESQTGIPTQATSTGPAYTTQATLLAAMTHVGNTYTASGNVVYNGNLTLSTNGTTYNFQSLYVTGNLTLNGTTTTNSTALYVGGNFTISGPSSTNRFGPIYVAGIANWNGGSSNTLSVQTTTLADPTTAGPMYAQILTVDGDTNGNYVNGSGAYNLVLGDVWIDGNAGTGNVAVNFSGPSGTASTVMCPLLATTEKTVSNGKVNFGTLTDPMVYFMQCDNDGLYTNTCAWASSGTFTGIMVIMEAVIEVSGGNDGTLAHSNIVGSILAGTPVATDITLSNNSTVCYNQAAIDNLPPTLQLILRTKTTTTVPGTWQQLSGN